MSLKGNNYQMGTVYLNAFEGDKGDVLPMHRHNEADSHFTIVARGSVRVSGPAFGYVDLAAGAMIDFLPGVDHELVVMEDNTKFYNIMKNVA